MKTVIIFGIAGFSGQYFEELICEKKIYQEYIFLGIDTHIDRAKKTGFIQYYKFDVSNFKQVNNFMLEKEPDYIINLIGSFSSNSLDGYYKLNVGITESICKAIISNHLKIKKMLVIGSAAEYGNVESNPVNELFSLNPVNLYGLSKVFQTELVKYYVEKHNLPIVIGRPFNIIGEGISESLSTGRFKKIIDESRNEDEIKVGNLSNFRDFLHIQEVVKYYWKLLINGNPGEIYNICSGESTKMEDILKKMIKQSGKSIKVVEDKSLFFKGDIPVIYGTNKKILELEE